MERHTALEKLSRPFRYSLIELEGVERLIKQSCNRCYGTGIVGQWLDLGNDRFAIKPLKKYDRLPIICKCAEIVEKEEESETPAE